MQRWIDGRFSLVTSAAVRDEVSRTLEKPYFRVEGVATHPEDDRVLEAAVSAGVDYLVTGDRGLQRLGEYLGIPILDPRAFREILDGLPPE